MEVYHSKYRWYVQSLYKLLYTVCVFNHFIPIREICFIESQSAECCIIMSVLECDACLICCLTHATVWCMFEMFSVEWWPFAILAKSRHHRKKCHQKFFLKNYPESTVLYIGARYRIIEKFQTGSRLDRKEMHYVLTKMGWQNPHLKGKQDFQPS